MDAPQAPAESSGPPPSGHHLVARFAHVTDAQIVDEQSPARLVIFSDVTPSAWRPQESASIHLLDGTIRAINLLHERVNPIDFVLFGGDAVDNVQSNELNWFLRVMDGGSIDPLSAADDRAESDKSAPALDRHAPLSAQGLYRRGVHGDLPSIPWYTVMGNHDRYAVGIFPIIGGIDGRRFAPLPGSLRAGLFTPTVLIPDGVIAYGPISPANPRPPEGIEMFTRIVSNPDRRYLDTNEFIAAHFETETGPPGHGFVDPQTSWYSVSPLPGLRLIGLDTTIPEFTIPAGVYSEGALSAEQVAFLGRELERAQASDEWIIVATHHPSDLLLTFNATSISPAGFRELLSAYPNVVAHLAGHTHRSRVWDRGGYLEFETSSVLDYPQQSRLIEIYSSDNGALLRYRFFSHLYSGSAFENVNPPSPAEDRHLPLRRAAWHQSCDHARQFNLLGPSQTCNMP